MSGSIHDKLNRVRKPRVHITYEVETEGAEIQRELPFVMGVMGDFSGDPTAPLQPLADRKFIQIDRDNFNDVMAGMTPGLNLKVDNKLADDGGQMAVDLKFNAIEDFEPGTRRPAGAGTARADGNPRQAARPDEQGRPLGRTGKPAGAGAEERRRTEIAVRASSAWTSKEG